MTSLTSHVLGDTSTPLLEITIGEALEAAARQWGDREALVSVHQGVRWSYGELLSRADRLASGLLELGLVPGDRVGVWAPNCAEWTLVQFATARVGLIQVNINPAYRSSELEYTLNKVGVKALICARAHKSSRYVEMVNELAPEISDARPGMIRAARAPHLRAVIEIGPFADPGWMTFEELIDVGRKGPATRVRDIAEGQRATQPINIQFTSGTTGLPKGATLSHRNLLNNARFVGQGMRLGQDDRLCIPVPLYHCFGMVMGNLSCLVHGSAMIYPSEAFDPWAVLHALAAERCTALHGVPTMFIAELEHPEFEQFDLSTLRTGLMAGSPCPVEVMKRVMDRMNMREVGIAYGMTETSPVSFQTAFDDPIERRVSTVGRVQPHLEVKVVGPDGGAVPRGEPGELCTRGYSVMLGYWEDPEKTAEAVDPDGWMHTGDLAVLDEEGYGNIVGRIKDMVIRGGENIYPREVEEYLFRHPKVEDVQVVGVPDRKYGEELCAWIRLRHGERASEQEIIEFCRERIAHYKIPRYVRFVDAFPMTVTGKVQKFEIRRAMIAELGRVEETTA
ncbi:MAG: AMP-binding protein [Alphaproteobacteria bacterium]|nr:AMP-binding protein [Alphaproteobacteria bacterium]